MNGQSKEEDADADVDNSAQNVDADLKYYTSSINDLHESSNADYNQISVHNEYDADKNQAIIFTADPNHHHHHLESEYFSSATHDNNSNIDFVHGCDDSPTQKMASLKQEHIININSGMIILDIWNLSFFYINCYYNRVRIRNWQEYLSKFINSFF